MSTNAYYTYMAAAHSGPTNRGYTMRQLINTVRHLTRTTRTNARATVRNAVRAVANAVAPYKISVYENGDCYEWGAHYAHSRAQALAWLAQYPQGTNAIVWGRRWQAVATRTA